MADRVSSFTMGRQPPGSKPQNKELPDEVGASKPAKLKSPHANSRNPSARHIIRTSVRRTRRSKECVEAPPNLGIWIEDPPVPQVTISDSEQEGFQSDSEDTAVPPEFANPYVEDTEDKLDYVIELTETNGRKLDALVSKVVNGNSSAGEESPTTYKALYVENRKKIDALEEQNRQLTMDLTIANAKVEMLRNNPQHLADLAGKVKDILMVASVPSPAINASTSEGAADPVRKPAARKPAARKPAARKPTADPVTKPARKRPRNQRR